MLEMRPYDELRFQPPSVVNPVPNSPHEPDSVGKHATEHKATSPTTVGSLFTQVETFRKGVNWSETLRSGRWLRPGDFVRDKVQSRAVLFLGLLACLIFITLLTVSDTTFLFPRNYAKFGKPDPRKCSMHCIMETDTNSSSDIANLISLVSDVVKAPEAAFRLDKCNIRWANMNSVVNETESSIALLPAPVFRVVDDMYRGVGQTVVNVTVSVANNSLSLFINPQSWLLPASDAGYANFDGVTVQSVSELGTVAKLEVFCPYVDCGRFSMIGVSFNLSTIDRTEYWLSVETPPQNLTSGQLVTLSVLLTNLRHLSAVPNAPVVMTWVELSDDVTLSPMPQYGYTDSSGRASFTFRVLSGRTTQQLGIQFHSIAPTIPSGVPIPLSLRPGVWVYNLTSSVQSLTVKKRPADVYLANREVTTSMKGSSMFYVVLLPRQTVWPDVVVCTSPAVANVSVSVNAQAISGFEGSIDGWTDISGLDTPWNMVDPLLDSDVGVNAITDADGCATFPHFRFLDGSNGMYALGWSVDGAVVYTGPHVLANEGVPDFTPMGFISGGGPLVTLWTILSFVFGATLVFGNKHHGLCSKSFMVLLMLAWWLGMIVFAFNSKGVFVAGTVLSSVHYVSTCCEFSQVSFTSAFLAIVLFLVSTAMLILFVILLARSLKDHCKACTRTKAEPTTVIAFGATSPNTVDAALDSGHGNSFDAAVEAEAKEYEEMMNSVARLDRSDSFTSTGTFVPRSKRERLSYQARRFGRWLGAVAKDGWFTIMHSGYFSRISHDDSRRLRYRFLVKRLLSKVRTPSVKTGSIEARLRQFTFVKAWSDRSETVVALRNMFVAIFEFSMATLALLYGLLLENLWHHLVIKYHLRNKPSLRWVFLLMDSSSLDYIPSNTGAASSWEAFSNKQLFTSGMSRLKSRNSMSYVSESGNKDWKTVTRVHCSAYARRAVRRTLVVVQTGFTMTFRVVACCVVLVKQLIVFVKNQSRDRNPFREFETWADFYFSQRILTAMLSSLFLCALLAVFLAVIASWMCANLYAAIAAYEDAMGQVNMRLLWPPGDSRYSDFSHIMFIGFGFLGNMLKKLIGRGTFDLVFQQIVPPAAGGLGAAVWLVMVGTWFLMLDSYRQSIMKGRRGQWKFDPTSVNAFSASRYIGYQTVHCVFGFFCIYFFVFIVALIIILLIFVKPLFPAVKRLIIANLFNPNGALFKLLLPLVIQQVLKLVLVNSRNQIRNMVLFSLFDFAFLVINFIIGALVVLKRSILIIVGLLLTFWRLDLDWISIDSGHAAYQAMLVVDCRENNPVVITFCDLVFREINLRRRMFGKKPHKDEDYVSCPLPFCCFIPLVPFLQCCYSKRGATMCTASDRSIFDDREYESVLLDKNRVGPQFTPNPLAKAATLSEARAKEHDLSDFAQAARRKSDAANGAFVDTNGGIRHDVKARYIRRQQIINRWWLYVVLSKNPILLRHRKQAAGMELGVRSFASRAIMHGFVERSMPKFGSRFSSFKKSYMVLRFGFLVFYGSMDARSPTGTIDLADVNSIDQLDDEPLTLALSLTQKEIKLRFVSPDEMKTWEAVIKQIWERPRANVDTTTSTPLPTSSESSLNFNP